VLPDIDAEERDQAGGGLQGILVGQGGQLQFARLLVEAQPAPAGALDRHGQRGQLLLELLEALPLRLDGLLQIIAGLGLVGREVLPEDGVVDVATAIETQGRSQLNQLGGVALRLGLLQGCCSALMRLLVDVPYLLF